MKTFFSSLLFNFFVVSMYAQIITLNATYTTGDIPTNYNFYDDNCPLPSGATLSITLPNMGTYMVTNVAVTYNMTAIGQGWMANQRSKIKFQNNNMEETEISGVGNSTGTYVYPIRNIAIANGTYAGGTVLIFKMMAQRVAVEGTSGCNTNTQKVDNNTWTITVTATDVARVGIGTMTPTEKLDVAGNIKTTGEIKPNGSAGLANQVLTSTGSGTMQWSDIPAVVGPLFLTSTFNTLNSTSTGPTGNAGSFYNSNSSNNGDGLSSYTNGLGSAGRFTINNSLNTNIAINALTTGLGTAGSFEINNQNSNGYGIYSSTNGFGTAGRFEINNIYSYGAGIYSSTNGFGKAGVFQINNSLNDNYVIHATTDGFGTAGRFEINNSSSDASGIFSSTYGLGPAGFFSILNSLNINNALHAVTNGIGTAGRFEINNISSYGDVIYSSTNGLGRAGVFEINNSLNTSNALNAVTNGLNKAGLFQINNTSNGNAAILSESNGPGQSLYATMFGTGKAGVFEINNGSNNEIALQAFTNGTGSALYSTNNSITNPTAYLANNNNTGLALETSGGLRFGGTNVGTPAAGKVLTATDASGLATWQAIPAVVAPLSLTAISGTTLASASSGSGTGANFSSVSGYALITGTGNVGIGTPSPSTKLEVAGQVKITGGSPGANKVLTSDAAGLATWQAIPAVVAPLSLTSTGATFSSTSTGASGRPGSFDITNATNSSEALLAFTAGTGYAGRFIINNSANTYPALNTVTNGTGEAARFDISNPVNNSSAVLGYTNGIGNAGVFEINNGSNNEIALEAFTNGTGSALYSTNNSNTNATANLLNNNANGLALQTSGGLRFGGTNVGTPAAGRVLTATDAFGQATWQAIPAVVAPLSLTAASGNTFSSTASGSGGQAGVFTISNTSNPNTALTASTNGLNKAGLFQINNASNANAAILCESNGTGQTIYATMFGTGTGLIVEHAGASGNIATFISGGNKARIDKAGKGFFNDGTQMGGADIAEAFDVIGERNSYEIGDVLVISENQDRAVEQSSKPYSTLVAGVYATKPGVLLTEENIDTDISEKVPMGVVGVIPTKVCDEGGSIKRGDLLVTSSKKGYAMKSDPSKLGFGQCIGKALQNFEGKEGKIQVLVNVK